MMCYKDKTFCPFCNECIFGLNCERALIGKVIESANKSNLYISQFTEKPDCYLEVQIRQDIVIKYLYFKELINSTDNYELIENFYIKHILDRTKGIEPKSKFDKNSPEKNNINDYLQACKDLLTSMQEYGFISEYAIPIGKNGYILNGAHRLACCYALKIKPCFIKFDCLGSIWDIKFDNNIELNLLIEAKKEIESIRNFKKTK